MAAIPCIYQAGNGRIWLNISSLSTFQGGLYYLDSSTSEFINVCRHFSDEFTTENYAYLEVIPGITGDSNGNIYLATISGLVFKVNSNFTPEVLYEKDFSTGTPKKSIYKSKNNLLWIGRNGDGIQISKSPYKNFKLLSHKTNPNFVVKSIRTIYEDKQYYWVGGYDSMVKLNKKSKRVSEIHLNLPNIYSIAEVIGNPNLLWLGTEGDGLKTYNKKENKLERIKHFTHSEVPDNFLNIIYCIYNVSDTLTLIGTMGGLIEYNPINDNYKLHNKIHEDSISHIIPVSTITKNNMGDILIGYTHGKVAKFNLKRNCLESFKLLQEGPLKNNTNAIKCIYNDTDNNYWIATANGLIFYNPQSNSTKTITETDGLPNNYIYSLLPDKEGNLWMSTNNGISYYLREEGTFQNFDVSDGLQSNEFNTGAYFKATDGTLFFGGVKGLNYFNPAEVRSNTILPKIEINSITLGNQQLELNADITKKNTLVIEPDQHVFTIDFVGLSYINSSKNRYKYRIKQIDDNWINIGNRHHITFNNMKHGKYQLEILASNNHGVWLPEPFKLNIIIKPTFFETPWFILILLITAFGIVFLAIRIRITNLERQKIKLQQLVEAQTKNLKDEIAEHKKTTEKLQTSNNTKDMFLSIIAHDILNPLGAIIGLSDILCAEQTAEETEHKKISRMINISANNLKELLHNLISWSKLERKKITPEQQLIVLKDEAVNCLQIVKATIDQKRIDLTFDVNEKHTVFVDINMFSTILRNILSNAIKFTPENGSILVTSSQTPGLTHITIKDSGVGMDKEAIEKILDTEKNATSRGTNNEMGTGIGLNLVLRFVELCNGKIKIESALGRGTTFTVTLPAK